MTIIFFTSSLIWMWKKGVKVFIKTHKKKLKGPLPTLMQCSCLFLFWNKWHALFGQHSYLAFSLKEKIVRCISACVSSSEKWLHNLPTKSVNKYCFSWDATKMQVTVFIFQICAVAIAFYCFNFSEMVMEDDGILNRQSLLSQTVREYSHGYQEYLIFAYKKIKTTYSGCLLNSIT